MIGRYPIVSLTEARAAAKKILAEKTLGHHQNIAMPFADALTVFFSAHCDQRNRPRTAKETKRLLNKHFLKSFGSKDLSAISPEEITGIIDDLMDRPQLANHALTAVNTFFCWSVSRRYITHNPCAGMKRPAKVASRERVLSDRELAHVYRTAEAYGYPFGRIVQLLILTGQRRGEITALIEDYIDLDRRLITLPKELTKNNRQHTFPYGQRTLTILSSLMKTGPALFPARGNGGTFFSGWSKSKVVFDKLCPIAHWTLHDLRRTTATGMAGLGTAPHVVEKYINHSSGSISGVAAIYNRFQYLDEMREAVRLWELHLSKLVSDPCI